MQNRIEGSSGSLRNPEVPLQGRYRLEFLARGGMGMAYRAVRGQRTYFVKEAALEEAEHLRREAQMLQRLPLGNFPRFVELFSEDGYLYLVTEFLPGRTLEQEVMAHPWDFPEQDELKSLALSLCEQVEILHSLKPPILYLDLKPGNVLRTTEGKLYLVDFGIAQIASAQMTMGEFQGSPQTASPEHYTGRPSVRSDLFSLAATVHYVATRGQAGRSPGDPFPAANRFHPALGAELLAWLERCLQLDPEQRFASVEEARLSLEGKPLASPAPPAISGWKRWLGLGRS